VLCKETHDTVMRFAPPLVIEKADIDWALARIAPILKN
jgi:ornithine--oxo-acid transaminase